MEYYGTFTTYRPDPLPDWLPAGVADQVVFAQNETGQDWYDVVKTLPPGKTLVTLWAGTNDVASVATDYEDWPVPAGQAVYLLEPTETAPELAGWWSPTGDAPPDPGPPALSPRQFEWLLAYTGFDTVWGAVEDQAKVNGDTAMFASLRAQRSASKFYQATTLAFKNDPDVLATAAAVSPNTDLSDEAIKAAWVQAAQLTFQTLKEEPPAPDLAGVAEGPDAGGAISFRLTGRVKGGETVDVTVTHDGTGGSSTASVTTTAGQTLRDVASALDAALAPDADLATTTDLNVPSVAVTPEGAATALATGTITVTPAPAV